MSSFKLMGMAVLACHLVGAAEDPATIPPVLRKTEPSDSGMVTLPGPRVKKLPPMTPPPPAATVAPAPPVLPEPPAVEAPAPKPLPDSKAIATLPKSFLPPDMQKEVAVFCQALIGQWTADDAEQLLGKALRNRPSYDDKKAVNGKILAYADPTGRYRELELDFDSTNGTLRTVFAYPKQMSWQECRRRWNGQFAEADARGGRTFYSYLNRRLDVLVDARGKVISLGLY